MPFLFLKKSGTIFNCRLLQIIGGALRVKRCRDRTFPTWFRQYKEKPVVDVEILASVKEYCLCKGPWDGRFMIQCDYCDECYHGSCINITPSGALDADKYQCGDCQQRLRL